MEEVLTDQKRRLGKEILKRIAAGTYSPPVKEDPKIAVYRLDPALYMKEKLGLKLTDAQISICNAVVIHRKVLVKASHSIGKSFVSAGLALWYYECFNPGKVITSAPNKEQIKDIIWGTMRTLAKGRFNFSPAAPVLRDGPEHFAVGITARDSNAFQGRHHKHLFIIFDEAVGIKREFWISANSMATDPENRILAICNPTDISSMAFDADRSGQWFVIEISSLDHPNVIAALHGQPAPYPGAASLVTVMEEIATNCLPINPADAGIYDFEFPPQSGLWYKPNGLFESRLMGRWPSSAINTIWGDVLWGEAIGANLTYEEKDSIQIGVDPGYLLDSSALHVRKGPVSLHHESHKGYDTSRTAGAAKMLCEKYGEMFGVNPKKIKVLIDSTGLGVGVVDQAGDYNFIGVNASSRAIETERFPNRRSELWFATRERVINHTLDLGQIDGNSLETLRAQLMSPTWKPDNQGRTVVEAKVDTKKKLGRSPDDADAFNLAYAAELDYGPPLILTMGGEKGRVKNTYDLTDDEEYKKALWSVQRGPSNRVRW